MHRKGVKLLVLIFLAVTLYGCTTTTSPPPPGFNYENIRKESSATIIQAGTMSFFSLAYGHGIASADVDQIDGKECTVRYTEPVYISPGKHTIGFRFVVSNAPKQIIYHYTVLTLSEGAVYRIDATYEGSPKPHVQFNLLQDGDEIKKFYAADVSFD